MFDKEYSFKGSHAEKVIKLTAPFSTESNAGLFQRNLDVYLVAPIVGFLYGRKAEMQTGIDRVINHTQLIYEKTNLVFNYRLIMLLDEKYEPNVDERINKAFRYFGSDKSAADEALYEEYVRGGVDVLYEKLIETANSPDDYIKNLYDFLEEFDERYNQAVSTEDIIDLCKLARS